MITPTNNVQTFLITTRLFTLSRNKAISVVNKIMLTQDRTCDASTMKPVLYPLSYLNLTDTIWLFTHDLYSGKKILVYICIYIRTVYTLGLCKCQHMVFAIDALQHQQVFVCVVLCAHRFAPTYCISIYKKYLFVYLQILLLLF